VNLAAPAVLAALVLAGCGSSTEPTPPATPRLPFPPRAQEPATSPRATVKPAGRVVRVGARPEGLAVDPASGQVGIATAEGLTLADAATGVVRRRVRLPAPARHLSFAGGRFLVPLENVNQLAEVSPAGGVRLTPAGGHPHDAAGAGAEIYVGDEFGGTLSVLRDGKLVRSVPVDVQPGGVAVTGEYVAVVSVRAYTVELLRRSDLARLGAQNAGYGPSHVVADAAGRLYVADTRGDALSVFETRPRLRFVARVALAGSPYGLAVDDARGRLWVTLTARNRLVELTLGAHPRVRRTLPTVRQPNSVAVDARSGTVFVASRSDGTLQLVSP
jgi:DNA-binding beta-propeller fold protein YncE